MLKALETSDFEKRIAELEARLNGKRLPVKISVLGGVIGILGGVGLSSLIKHTTELRTFVSVQSIMMSLGFALGIGIFFGFYPALRAARLHPIEALARE